MTLLAEDLVKPSWQCVHFTDSAPLAESLARLGVHAVSIDGSQISSKLDLMSALSAAFDFPGHFGENWDALGDSLRDLSWLEVGNHALTVESARALWQGHPELAGGLVESWLGAARRWADLGIGFHLVFEL
jgi:hypothetical protein